MRNLKAIRLIVVLTGLLLAVCGAARANFYESGQAAYSRGDFGAAVNEWMQGAQQGNVSSQYALGRSYERGEGVPLDDVLAVKWYRKAAEQGSPAALNSLGVMYYAGRGVAKDDREAVKCFYGAAMRGALEGMVNLALSYEEGAGVPRDYSIASIILVESAKRGFVPAQVDVALLYVSGFPGAPQSYSEAYMWLGIAMPNLSGERKERLIKRRAEIATHMTFAERAKMDQLIQEWKPVISKTPAGPVLENITLPGLPRLKR